MKAIKDFVLIALCIIAAGCMAGGLVTLFILGIAVVVGLILKANMLWLHVLNGALTCGAVTAIGLICCYIIVWYDNNRVSDTVYRFKNNKLFRKYAFKRIIGFLAVGKERRNLLSRYGWYRTIPGGYAHPHAMDYMTAFEIRKYTPAQLEYKLKHGSMAELPPELCEEIKEWDKTYKEV